MYHNLDLRSHMRLWYMKSEFPSSNESDFCYATALFTVRCFAQTVLLSKYRLLVDGLLCTRTSIQRSETDVYVLTLRSFSA
jgi:hypothetical protein